MQINKSVEVSLPDKTIIDVSLCIETTNSQEADDFSYEYDDAGLTELQLCVLEDIIESNCDAWIELALSGEDLDYEYSN
jgi:hypothetical protein